MIFSQVFTELLTQSDSFSDDFLRNQDISDWPWQRLCDLCDHHLLSARMANFLVAGGHIGKIPAEARARVIQSNMHAHQTHALYQSYLPKLTDAFNNAGIEAVLLKGLSVALRFYPKTEERIFRDFDFLFPSEQRSLVERTLESLGFQRSTEGPVFEANESKSEFVLKHNPEVVVECHFALGYGPYKIDIDFKNLPRSSSLKHLHPEDEYLFLLYHLSAQHRFQKLVWLLDLAQMHRQIDLSNTVLRQKAQQHGLGPAIELSWYFLSQHCGITSLPIEQTNSGLSRWFERIASTSVESSTWQKVRLRAMAQGGWLRFSRYAFARQRALRAGADA